MEYFIPGHATGAGRPILLDEEVEVHTIERVAIYGSDRATKHHGGTLTITTHRLLWVSDERAAHRLFTSLACVADVRAKHAVVTFSSPKLLFAMQPSPHLLHQHAKDAAMFRRDHAQPAAGARGGGSAVSAAASALPGVPSKPLVAAVAVAAPVQSAAAATPALPTQPAEVSMAFRGGGSDVALREIHRLVERKYWESASASDTPAAAAAPGSAAARPVLMSGRAGIAGLLRGREHAERERSRQLSEAFTDMRTLMNRAADMVKFVERVTAAHSADTAGDDTLSTLLFHMGIASPVTRKSAGARFHRELARQLADMLRGPLRDSGGLMLLTDVYCLVNRARGTELLSPSDLNEACGLMGELELGMCRRKLESGVVVVQLSDQSDRVIAQRMRALVDTHGPLTAFDVSVYAKISLALAREELLTAEREAFVCRDETLEGVRFHANYFFASPSERDAWATRLLSAA